jgi:hypothetical protein
MQSTGDVDELRRAVRIERPGLRKPQPEAVRVMHDLG